MKTPKSFEDNLSRKIITDEMYFECLFSMAKRIDNANRKIREGSNYEGDYIRNREIHRRLQNDLYRVFDRETMLEDYQGFAMKKTYHEVNDLISVQFVEKLADLIKKRNRKNRVFTLWTELLPSDRSYQYDEGAASAEGVSGDNDRSGKEEHTSDITECVYYAVCTYFSKKQICMVLIPENDIEKSVGTVELYLNGRFNKNGFSSIPNTGKYKVAGDTMTIIEDFLETEHQYQIDGKYLISHENDISFGMTPEGDSFDAVIKNDKYSYIFKKDGSFEYLGSRKQTGTYERKDDFLILKYDNGDIRGALVKDGYFNNGAYVCEESLLE